MNANITALPWARVPAGDVDRGTGHGRAETRTIKILALRQGQDLGLAGARQAIRVHRWRRGKKSPTMPEAVFRETVHYLTSLPPEQATPAELADMIRGHLGVEVVHHLRDTGFDEDRHTARTGHGPANLASLRNTTINLYRRRGTDEIQPSRRASARKPYRVLALLNPQDQL